MGFLKGIIRTALSPVEVAARATSDIFSDQCNDEVTTALDVITLGTSRVIRGVGKGTSDAFEGIVDEFDE